ncbi:MAG: EamA family transporter [Ruminococcaceae bacterium]|nr:EamA family transporter [Oscillospiraceae bacterium]
MKKLAVLLVAVAGTLWGMIGYFVRGFQELELSSMQIVAIRMVVSAVVFSLFALVFKRKLFCIKLKDLWCFLGTGVVSVATFSFCYFKAIEYSSLSQASILLYTAPIFVMIFSIILFKEKLTVIKAVSLMLAFFGCLFVTGVFTQGVVINTPAILFGIGSGVCYALYSIFSRLSLDRGYSPLTVTLYTFIFAGVAALCVIDIKPVADLMTRSADDLLFCVVFAVLSCVLPYVTYTLGLKYIRPTTASIVASIEPVVATITGAVVFSEAVEFPFGYIGIALVIGSIVLINLTPKRKEENAHE